MKGSNRSPVGVPIAILLTLLQPVPALSQSARGYYEEGREAYATEDFTAAVQRFRDATEINPGFRDAWVGLSRAFRELNELDNALEAVRSARRHSARDTEVINLEGDILLLRGRIEEAREAFERAIELEPNNIDARIGIAELNLADDRRDRAIDAYLEALELNPQSRRALLSLVVLYEDRGEIETASRYLALALEFHPRDPIVHELAGESFLLDGETGRAREHARTAISLASNYRRAWDLLVRTELTAGNYEDARAAAEQLVDLDSGRSRSWYLLGLSQRFLEDYESAVDTLDRATGIDPDDELSRLALESAVEAGFDLEDSLREEIASYRFARAGMLAQENLFRQAIADYRRGLSLYPFSRDGRYELSILQRRRGFPGKHLEELRILESLGHDDRDVLDGISTYESVLADGVAARWGLDQFDAPRDRMTFSLFYRNPAGAGTRPQAARYVVEYMRHRLLGSEPIDVAGSVRGVSSAEEAYSAARAEGIDYYLIGRFSENDRSIELDVQLRHGATGTLIAELRAVRSGSRRVQRAASAVAAAIEAEIPARGRLLERRGNEVLVNLGRAEGLEEEDVLLITRRGRVSTSGERVGYSYDEADVVGRVTVNRVDDLVAEGRVEREGFFDLIEIGDTVLQQREGQVTPIDERPAFSPLYFRIRELRGSAQN